MLVFFFIKKFIFPKKIKKINKLQIQIKLYKKCNNLKIWKIF